MLDIAALQALTSVARTGSITTAAEALHITASAVSQRIAKLERDTGQAMLDRHGRGVRLTAVADLLTERAEKIFALVAETEADLEQHRGCVLGTLRVAGFPTAARGLLPAVLTRLRVEHPQLRVESSEHEPDSAIAGVVRGDIDLAVVQDWVDAPLEYPAALDTIHLVDDPVDVALPPGHPLHGRAEIEFASLSDAQWVSWPHGSMCHRWLLHTLQDQGIRPTIAHTAAEYSTQLALVSAGFGVAVIPRLGRVAVPAGVWIAPVHPPLTRRVSAIWQSDRANRPSLSSAIRAIVAATRLPPDS